MKATLLPALFVCCLCGGVTSSGNLRAGAEGYSTPGLSSSHVSVPSTFCDPSSPPSQAGYFGVEGSAYDADNSKRYFYWLFPKRTTSIRNQTSSTERSDERGKEDTPLVLWLNGGPGCSSLVGALKENGPCLLDDNATDPSTHVNPYSWTEVAHVLYLEQPAGTGYSYGIENDSNSAMVAEDVYYFLQHLFLNEEMGGSKYAKLPFYITGESYAGHYIPAIAHSILYHTKKEEGVLKINLAGVAIGNGAINKAIQMQSKADMAFNNSHGIQLVNETTYHLMKHRQDICVEQVLECKNAVNELERELLCQKANNCKLFNPLKGKNISGTDISKPHGNFNQKMAPITKFLNDEATKQTLGVPDHVTWTACSNGAVEHVFGIPNGGYATDWYNSSTYLEELLDSGIPVLIYNGDLDFVCDYLGGKAVAMALNWTHGDGFRQAKDHDWANGAGLVRSSHNLTYLQVYGAGHMVPSDQPKNALTMIQQFVSGEPLQ